MGAGGNRAVNIYKNLIREFRMYFNDRFVIFANERGFKKKNNVIYAAFFQVMIREYIKSTFASDVTTFLKDQLKDK